MFVAVKSEIEVLIEMSRTFSFHSQQKFLFPKIFLSVHVAKLHKDIFQNLQLHLGHYLIKQTRNLILKLIFDL